MPDMILYDRDYGQRVTIHSYCSDIAESTVQRLNWRKEGTNETFKLSASVVPVADLEKLEHRSVVATVPAYGLRGKAGLWTVTAELTFADGPINGDPVTVLVKRSPTLTTTTTSTTSTTSTTTA